jgi:hypothetical protein
MRWVETRLGFTCLALLVLGGSSILLPNDVTSAQSRELTPAEVTPAEIVAFRFPANWSNAQAAQSSQSAARSGSQRVASMQPGNVEPAYKVASADRRSATLPRPRHLAVTVEHALPEDAFGNAAPATESGNERRAPAAEAINRGAGSQHSKRVAVATPPRMVKQSSKVFTDSEIAGIETKLKLTPRQQAYWPAVASALRDIDYAGRRDDSSLAIDPNSPGVQQLKSAAFPLIMSFDEEQKSQVRQLARNLGLESVASAL